VAISAAVTIGATPSTITVTDELDCKKVGTLSVKKVVNPDPLNIGSTLSFPMTVVCTPPPPGLPTSYPLNLNGNSSNASIIATVGSNCVVTEGNMPPLPPGCHWQLPGYSPTSVPIASGLNYETVTNGYRCEILTAGSLIVTKQVIYNGPIVLPSQIYPVTVTCGSTITNLNLVPGAPQTVSNIPLNTSCSIVEGPPPNVCPPHTTPMWTTVYVPPSPITITGTGIAELVKNTLTCGPVQPNVCPPGTVPKGTECVPTIVCHPPLMSNAAGTDCVCGRGLVLRGGKCVEPIVCQPPATLNSAGTGCICPRGMIKKGNTCVEPEHNPQIEIPRGGLPGLGGFGGGGGPRGGGQGGAPGGEGQGGGPSRH
jgi:hypothetical protein